MTDIPAIAAELRRLLPHAHAPYSGVQVAAAVEATDGRVSYGVNVENAAYPQGLCAEASAISAAVTQGVRRARPRLRRLLPSGPDLALRRMPAEDLRIRRRAAARSSPWPPDGEVGRQTIEQLLPFGFRLEPGQGRRR